MTKYPTLAIGCLYVWAAASASRPIHAMDVAAPTLSLDPNVVTLDAAASQPRDIVDQIKQPNQYFRWGADERMRIEYFDNAITLNQHKAGHEWDFFRYRSRIWTTISPRENVDINARLAWEGRHWQDPRAVKHEWDDAQGFVDTLNAKVTVPGISAAFTVGRQDIILGDGWLVLEGTPLDGSTSIYFDAVRGTTQFKDLKTTVDLIYINQYSDPDIWMPTINDTDRAQIEQNERGAIAYFSNKSIQNTEIDPYFIYKHDVKVLANGDAGDIYTFGTRVVEDFTPNLRGRVEAAGQFGDKNGRSLAAWGANSRLTYSFNDTLKNELRFNAEYLSGDKPGDKTDQAFDPLWGRWPQFSELYVYTYAKETRIAQTTNLLRFGPGYVVHPLTNMELEFDYNALFANENTLRPTGNTLTGFAASGNYRGSLFSSILRYKFNRFLAGHVWGEYLIPGKYYDSFMRDNAVYLRGELVLTF